MRINKYIASSGIASRRKADELIEAGKVKVNGSVMKTPGYDVLEDDVVEVLGKVISGKEEMVYLALNKPLDYITTTDDEFGRPTVVDLMHDIDVRVFPVGRLDADTTGLLIMTNDGNLTYHLSHPSQKVWKTYIASIDGLILRDEIEQLKAGVDIGGYTTKPAEVRIIKQVKNHSVVEVKISEGKNRQVRKMFKAVGYNVISLERIAIGKVLLGHLHVGDYRKLTKEEIDYLKNA